METALAHDYLLVLRGAERTFAEMAVVWPQAPIYTLLYDEAGTRNRFAGRDVRVSPVQRLRVRQSGFRRMLPLFPWAIEEMDLGKAKVVVSSSSAFAHGVTKPDGATHICYCHSPFRYAWHERAAELATTPFGLRQAEGILLGWIRDWDLDVSSRVDHYIANSRLTQDRLRRCYGRDSTIIHPPVSVDRFAPAEPEDWFLVVGEIVRHKRMDIALAAAERAGVQVKVVGQGPELTHLATRFHRNAEFLGRVGDAELAGLYARARALIVPNIEEFGIVAVEAQAAGRPVIGLAAGGTGETVIDSVTGLLLERADVTAMAEAMTDPCLTAFDPERLCEHAAGFAPHIFRERLSKEVARVTGTAVVPSTTELGHPRRKAS